MRNKLLKTTIITLIILLLIPITAFASTLNIKVEANKQEIKAGEEVTVKVSWNKGMQAADFSIIYNPKVMEYISCDLDDMYTNNENGEVKTAWFSLDDQDKKEIEYTFKAIKGGKSEFSIKVNGGFADGNLQMPDNYNSNEITVNVPKSPIILIIAILAIFIIIAIVAILKNKTKKRKRKSTSINTIRLYNINSYNNYNLCMVLQFIKNKHVNI